MMIESMQGKKKVSIKAISVGSQQGFTFIELVIVIILLGLLAAAALPRLLGVTDDAQIAALEGVAGGFSTAVSIAHVQWAAEGNMRGVPVTSTDKRFIDLDGRIIFMNENGWPANTDPGADASENSQTAAECQQVWNSVLQSAPSSTINPNNRANARYFISVIDGNPDFCRFELIVNNDPGVIKTHYFDYSLGDGQVVIFRPLRI